MLQNLSSAAVVIGALRVKSTVKISQYALTRVSRIIIMNDVLEKTL